MRCCLINKLGEYIFSLPTACGYAASYKGTSDRKVSALFGFDSLGSMVNIPINQVAYNVFNGFWMKHHTSIPFTYDSKNVYMNDPNLHIFAWGGASGKRDFIRDQFPQVAIAQPVTERVFANLLHPLGEPARQLARDHGVMTYNIEQYLVVLDLAPANPPADPTAAV